MADKYDVSKASNASGRIMRTVYFTLCEGDVLDEGNAKASPYHDVLIGKYTPKRATRTINGKDPGKHIRITHTVVMSQLVSMSFWEFWQYAEASDDPKVISEWILDQKIS